MLSSARLAAILLPALLAAAVPQAASADERCSGTFCDLYYGGPAPETPAVKPDARTPLTAPSGGILGFFSGKAPASGAPGTAAPAPTSRVQVQGGGLLGMAKGAPAERCSGTLCDLYYGGPAPSEKQAEGSATQPGTGAPEAVAATEPAAPQPRVDSEALESTIHRAPPRCAAGRDPWSCYR